MRLAPFFTISLALHASVLAYPIAFHGWKDELLIAVTIMPMESDAGADHGDSGPAGNQKISAARTLRSITKPIDEVVAVARTVSEPMPAQSAIAVSPTREEAKVMISSSSDDAEIASADSAIGRTGGSAGSNGFGLMGTGSGNGSEAGSGQSGSLFTQARYRNTPNPVYPQTARREGREGRVLLRVLIDDQGKTKTIEVNRSSGSAALDQAAAEAIRLWRFHPAMAGEKPVETWVTIPIDFRLMDEKN